MSVVVFGSLNVDFVARVRDFPAPGETSFGTAAQFPGGKGLNQAVASARAGADTRLLGAVGRDSNAQFLWNFLGDESLSLRLEEVEAPTGTAFVQVNDAGENCIVVCPGANLQARADLSAFGAGDVALCQGETDGQATQAFLSDAKARGLTTVFNPAPFFDAARGFLGLVDLLIVNAIEFQQLFGADAAPTAETFRAAGLAQAIVTRGGEDALIFDGTALHSLPVPPAHVVDTTGAGDCFCGVTAACLSQGADLPTAAATGLRFASKSVESPGAAVSMPRAVD